MARGWSEAGGERCVGGMVDGWGQVGVMGQEGDASGRVRRVGGCTG